LIPPEKSYENEAAAIVALGKNVKNSWHLILVTGIAAADATMLRSAVTTRN
jgi:hypothetical protein